MAWYGYGMVLILGSIITSLKQDSVHYFTYPDCITADKAKITDISQTERPLQYKFLRHSMKVVL